jgi:hypothetical protein
MKQTYEGIVVSGTIVVVAIAVILLSASQCGAASPTPSPRELLGAPDRFDGRPVRVYGRVTNLRNYTTARGDQYIFLDLAHSGAAVRVILLHRPPACVDGTFATAEGIFQRTRIVGRNVYVNVIDGSTITCSGDGAEEGVRSRSRP